MQPFLTFVATKLRRVLETCQYGQRRDIMIMIVNSLHKPRQFAPHGIEDFRFARYMRQIPSCTTDKNTLQYTLSSPNLQHKRKDGRVCLHRLRAEDVGQRERDGVFNGETFECSDRPYDGFVPAAPVREAYQGRIDPSLWPGLRNVMEGGVQEVEVVPCLPRVHLYLLESQCVE